MRTTGSRPGSSPRHDGSLPYASGPVRADRVPPPAPVAHRPNAAGFRPHPPPDTKETA